MLCPDCNSPLVGPTCPCGWEDEFPPPFSFQDEELSPYPFKTIQPAEFLMGSSEDEEGRDLDEHQHHVLLTQPYAIGCTEVPQDLYFDVMLDNPSHFIGDRRPVDSVSWLEACVFCNAYSAYLGRVPVYRFEDNGVFWDQHANGFRLPTEAEWEYAARQAQKVAPLSTQAWFQENANWETHSVGRNSGVSDMAGNVWEWVWDWYAPYPTHATNPTGPERGEFRVARGGCWADDLRVIRPANRAYQSPDHSSNTIGFRIAHSIFPATS